MDNTPQQEAPEESPPKGQEAHDAPDASNASDAPDGLEALQKLAQAAKLQRLAPAEEDHAVALLVPLLGSGKSSITSLLETLVALPWIVSVNAITAVWPEWTPVMRRHLLSGLAKIKTDQALRLRLSLARAVFKIEPPAALKIAAGTLPDLLDAETGTLTPKHRQIFFNVLIGKGKPWLLQLPLDDFKPSEADTIVHCAVETFPFCPPLSQFSILRWTHAGGRFKKISEADLAIIAKSVSRWNGKLQRQLKAEIEELPEAITAVFKPMPAPRPEEKAEAPAEAAGVEEAARTPTSAGLTEPAEPAEEPATQQPATEGREEEAAAPEAAEENAPEAAATLPAEPGAQAPADRRPSRKEREREERRNKRDQRDRKREGREHRRATAAEEAGELPEDEEDLTREVAELEAIDGIAAETHETAGVASDEDEEGRSRPRERRREREERRDREERRPERSERLERPERVSDRGGSRQKTPFDFKESLRGLETYVSSLRSELEQTKAQLRRKEEDTRRGDRRRGGSADERLPVDVEALQKHNAQLEQAVTDLRQQLEDLASHHEAIAESREMHGNEPLPEGSAPQLCKLLSIKLQEDYETYTAMRLEPLDRVFRLDYRDLLGQVFDILIEQGVKLRATTPKG